MSADLEDRLRHYGRVLDRVAVQHTGQEPVATPPGRLPTRRLVALATAVAVAAAAIVVVGFVAGDDSGYRVRVAGEGRAAGPQLERDDDGSFPRLLIDGWTLIRADEYSGPMADDPDAGYHGAEATFSRRGAELELRQEEGDEAVFQSLVEDRADSAHEQRSTEVLGYRAEVTRYQNSQRYAAMWFADGVVYELDGDAGGEEPFFDALADLRVVDNDVWEAAQPDSSVTPRERAAEVDRMLGDIPQPDGFDAAVLKEGKAVSDRYQLGAKVAGAVACAWIDRWAEARRSGDQARVDEAVDAMATSREWQVLNDMNEEGDYSEVLWEYADALAGDGTIRGGRDQTVEESAPDALGCPRRSP